MMNGHQGNMLAYSSRLPTKQALNQRTSVGHGKFLIIASSFKIVRFLKVTELYNYLQTIFFMVI